MYINFVDFSSAYCGTNHGHQGRDGHGGAKHGEGCGGSQDADPRPSRERARLSSPGGVIGGVHEGPRHAH